MKEKVYDSIVKHARNVIARLKFDLATFFDANLHVKFIFPFDTKTPAVDETNRHKVSTLFSSVGSKFEVNKIVHKNEVSFPATAKQ